MAAAIDCSAAPGSSSSKARCAAVHAARHRSHGWAAGAHFCQVGRQRRGGADGDGALGDAAAAALRACPLPFRRSQHSIAIRLRTGGRAGRAAGWGAAAIGSRRSADAARDSVGRERGAAGGGCRAGRKAAPGSRSSCRGAPQKRLLPAAGWPGLWARQPGAAAQRAGRSGAAAGAGAGAALLEHAAAAKPRRAAGRGLAADVARRAPSWRPERLGGVSRW